MKCQQCGEEVDLPFRCTYCQGYFYVDYKLPQNHQCSELPKKPLLLYQKKKLVEKRVVHIEDSLGTCPECGSVSSDMIDYDAKIMTSECKKCGHRWAQLKSPPHHIIESKDVLESKTEPKREL